MGCIEWTYLAEEIHGGGTLTTRFMRKFILDATRLDDCLSRDDVVSIFDFMEKVWEKQMSTAEGKGERWRQLKLCLQLKKETEKWKRDEKDMLGVVEKYKEHVRERMENVEEGKIGLLNGEQCTK